MPVLFLSTVKKSQLHVLDLETQGTVRKLEPT